MKSPKTVRELAERLACSRQLLSYHRKQSDAPALHDVSGWETYLAAHVRVGALPPALREKIGEERWKLLRAQRCAVEKSNAEATDLISRAEVCAEIDRAIFITLKKIESLLTCELPPLLTDQSDPHRIASIAKDRWDALADEIRFYFILSKPTPTAER